MAIYNIHNIVESVRAAKTPYWKIYRTVVDRAAGNYICAADFENPELGIEASCEQLRTMLMMQTPGRYVMTAYRRVSDVKGGLGSDIEIEYKDAISAAKIGATEQQQQAYVEGIGMVTLDNIGEVIDKKIKLIADKKAEEARIRSLEEDNKRLKEEARENDTGLNKGIMAIGAIVWNQVRSTPLGKEVLGMVSQFNSATSEKQPGKSVEVQDKVYSEHSVSNDDSAISGTEAPPEMVNALTDLSENNPELTNQLVMLAKLKKDNPDLFQDAIENLKLIAG